jgi:hypothetical protein
VRLGPHNGECLPCAHRPLWDHDRPTTRLQPLIHELLSPSAVKPSQPIDGHQHTRGRAKLEFNVRWPPRRPESCARLAPAIERLLELRDEQRRDRGEPIDVDNLRIRRRRVPTTRKVPYVIPECGMLALSPRPTLRSMDPNLA